ncbi:alpha/beta hydrolase [Spirosoma sp. RP8]|uniref:Alpha/beta hydrolase n=1 Tax=Spirosoma liriopis TaxID=2937440 RepID=A0ABT0HV08_9BACT|nr:alpha/beta hydrolase [Spirosoma liriopis]MCK8495984.1 alpha/beta hydrolase [Spirosoma liriopis]
MLTLVLPPYVNNLTLQKVAGSGHFVQEEKPVETARFISDFLG